MRWLRADVMMFLSIVVLGLLMILAMGCSQKTGTVIKTAEGIEFNMRKTGKLTYKDADVTAEMDTRKNAGVIEAIIQLWTIKQLEGK